MRWSLLAMAALVTTVRIGGAQEPEPDGEETGAPALVTKQRWITVSTETTRITEPLDERGFVDYVAWANARGEGIAAKENIVVGIWEALGYRSDSEEEIDRVVVEAYFAALGIPVPERPKAPPLDFVAWFEVEVGFDEAAGADPFEIEELTSQRPWTDAEFPLFARFLDVHAASLSRAAEALGRESWFAPRISTSPTMPSLVTAWMPELMLLRDIAEALVARAFREAGRGRSAAALRELGVARAGFRRISGGTLIEFLVARACDGLLARAVARVAVLGDASAEELGAALAAIGSLPAVPDLARLLDERERLFCLDGLTTLIRDPSALDSDGALSPLSGIVKRAGLRVGFDWNAVFESFHREFDELVAAAREETIAARLEATAAISERLEERSGRYSTALEKFAAMATPASRTEYLGTLFEALLIPGLASLVANEETTRVEMDLCRLSVAIALHRARHGALPARLEDLIPGELGAVPGDPFRGGKPLRYRPKGDAFELASAGSDGEWSEPGENDWPDDSGDDVVLDLSTPEAAGGWRDEEADDFDEADEADEAVVPPKASGVGTGR